MPGWSDELARLVEAAERTYRRARADVYDRLPPGACVDLNALTASQADTFTDFMLAETELANYRQIRAESDRHAPLPATSAH